MNDVQRDRFLQLMVQHFPNGTQCYGNFAKWDQISKILNSLGAEKTVFQWKGVWRDFKCGVQTKLRSRRLYRDKDPKGEFPENLVFLDEDYTVLRVCGIIALEDDPYTGELRFESGDEIDLNSTPDSNISSEILEVSCHSPVDLQKQMVDLQQELNAIVQQISNQQKETNKFLNQILLKILEHNILLQKQFKQQKKTNIQLAALKRLER